MDVVRGRRWVEERQLRKVVRWWVSWDLGGGGEEGWEGGSSLDRGTWGKGVHVHFTGCLKIKKKLKDIFFIFCVLLNTCVN